MLTFFGMQTHWGSSTCRDVMGTRYDGLEPRDDHRTHLPR